MAKKKDAEVQEVQYEIIGDGSEATGTTLLEVTPTVAHDGKLLVEGNYNSVKTYLEKRRDEILTMKVSAKNIELVKAIKKEAVNYRTSIADFQTKAKRKYFNGPKDVFDGLIAGLLSIAGEIEAKADKVIDAEEKKRVDELTEVFNLYKAEFQAKYHISDAALATVEFKKEYYNKTAVEAESKKDIEEQFKTISDREKARVAGEKLIRRACGTNAFLDVEKFVSMLDDGKDVSLIIDEIEAEEARLDAAARSQPAVQTSEAPISAPTGGSGKLVVGVIGAAASLAEGTDFPGKTKKLLIEVEYPVDLGEALTDIFKELAKRGIKSRVVNPERPAF